MKVLTILGTRPEIIRLSLIISKLDPLCQHVLVHTGQNYDFNLNDIFFQQLKVRQPDYFLGVRSSTFGEQISKILTEIEKVFLKEKPDKFLVLGDTNSSLAAIIAKRMAIPVYHMEAGNRCYDNRVPEEVNRRIIDHSSDILMPYTERSRANLIKEGIEGQRIYVTGNPIFEVISHYEPYVKESTILEKLYLSKGKYFLVTMHREENVDIEERFRSLIKAFDLIQKKYQIPVICSLHPRTNNRMQKFCLKITNDQVKLFEPFGFFDFISLERNAFCVLSDSGTVQEECCIFKIPNVTIRDVTERPETIESGSNILSGADTESVMNCVNVVLNQKHEWTPPCEYLMPDVSSTVVKIVLGYRYK
jgi:UDP-N-acetylglucosamine 2-epimerase (non-hydrolysing)